MKEGRKTPWFDQLSLEGAIAVTSEARCVTTAKWPFTIIHTNKAWSELTGYKFVEAVGRTCSFLQGPATLHEASLELLGQSIRAKQKVTLQLINYTRDGAPFINTIECSPVLGGTHFYATLTGHQITDGSVKPLPVSVVPAAYETPPPVNYASRQRIHHLPRMQRHIGLEEVRFRLPRALLAQSRLISLTTKLS